MTPLFFRFPSRRKLLLGFLVLAITTIAAFTISRKVDAGGIVRIPTQNQGPSKNRKISLGTAQSKKARLFPNLDIRVTAPADVSKMIGMGGPGVVSRFQAHKALVVEGLTRLKANAPFAEAKLNSLTGAVEVLRSNKGALTGPAPNRSGDDIVRSFISENRAIYGLSRADINSLRFLGESVNRGNGMRMIRVEQTINGHSIFQSESRFILNAEGRIYRSTGLFIPNASETAGKDLSALISPTDALARSMAMVDVEVDTSSATQTNSNLNETDSEIVTNSADIAGNVTSKLVYFPVAPGLLIPAWSPVTFTNGDGDWYTLVDATSGKVLWRKNMRANVSVHDARFRVYVQADGTTPADSPAPLSPSNATVGSHTQPPGIAPTIVSMFTAMSNTASPNGWIDDCPGGVCTAAQTQTIGNNVHAYLDRVGGAGAGGANQPDTAASSVIDGTGKPMGNPDSNGRNRDFLGTTPRDFQTNYLPPPQGGNPEAGQTPTGNGNNGTLPVDQFRRGMLTQLFYVTNWYHDRLFLLGFDEAAGNFQNTNFS